MKSDKELIKQFREHYRITKGGLKNQYREIEECRTFYNGDYMNYRDQVLFGRGSSRRVQEVSFNRIKPYVNSVVGFYVQNRRKIMYSARSTDTNRAKFESDYINGYSDYIRQNNYANQIETKQDFDLTIGGVGVVDTMVTTKAGTATTMPSGEILQERVDPLECGWDPLSKAPNLLDSRWVYRAKDYDVQEALDMFDADESDFETIDPTENIKDYEFNPYGGIQDKIGFEYADPKRRQMRVYFYQWYEIQSYYRIENPLLKQYDANLARMLQMAFESIPQEEGDEAFAFNAKANILTITKENRKQVKDIFDAFGILFDPVTEKRKVFYTAVLSGDKVFQKYKSVSQQGYSLKFKVGDKDEKNNMYTGIVSSMKQPQRYYNKALTEFMLIIAGNSRGGVIAEKGAIGNIQEFEAKYARNNSVVEVEDLTRIRDKATPQMNTGYEFIMQVSGGAFEEVSGISETMFGVSASGNETAMLQRQRVKQASTVLATYVDSIGMYQQESARLLLSFMKILASVNKDDSFPFRNKDGQLEYVPLSDEYMADEYDVVLSEAPETDVQKDYYAQMLINLANMKQQTGQFEEANKIYSIAVKQLPLNDRDKEEVTQALSQGQPIDPMIVEQLQIQLQNLTSEKAKLDNAKQVADINKTNAETQDKLAGLGKKSLEEDELREDIEAKALENDILALKPIEDVNATV